MQEPHLETLIKTYNNSGEYKRGAAKLIERGWTIKDTSQGQRNRSLAGKVIVPFGMFTKPTEILVTYERVAGATVSPNVKLSGTEKKYVPLGMPPGLPFMQQAEWIKTHKGENLEGVGKVPKVPSMKLSAVERKYVPLGMSQGLPYIEQVRWVKAYNHREK